MGLERTVARAPDARGRIYGPRPSDLQMSGGSVGGMPGGWTSQEVNDQGVQKAAKFACDKTFEADFKPYNSSATTDPNGKGKHQHRYQVVEAETQVVAGVNYRLTVDVYKPDDGFGLQHCSVEKFVVYDRFGNLTVTSHEPQPLLGCMDISKAKAAKK